MHSFAQQFDPTPPGESTHADSRGSSVFPWSAPAGFHLGLAGSIEPRIGMGSSFPWFIDSVVCIGIILHGLSGSRPDTYFLSIPLPFIRRTEVSLSLVFLLSGYYSFLCALAASPYKALYAMAAIGAISLAFSIIDRYREVGSSHHRTNRKHSHRH